MKPKNRKGGYNKLYYNFGKYTKIQSQKGESMKKLLSLILVLAMMTVTTTTAFANPTSPYNWSKLSQETGIGITELQDAYNLYGEDLFSDLVAEVKNAYAEKQHVITPYVNGSIMTDAQWMNFKSLCTNGTILISQDSMTAGFMHGHCGIVSDASGSGLSRTVYVVEAPGSGQVSKRTSLDAKSVTWWRQRVTLRAYDVVSSTGTVMSSKMSSAARTSTSGLILGKPYNALAPVKDTNIYNCATLVNRCYYANGIKFSTSDDSTLLPRDIDKHALTMYKYSKAGWANW